jgi:hypothetical protein
LKLIKTYAGLFVGPRLISSEILLCLNYLNSNSIYFKTFLTVFKIELVVFPELLKSSKSASSSPSDTLLPGVFISKKSANDGLLRFFKLN